MTDPITRRLALAALRLSVFALGFSGSRMVSRHHAFAALARWVGADVGEECGEQAGEAMREAVAALVEVGEVKP